MARVSSRGGVAECGAGASRGGHPGGDRHAGAGGRPLAATTAARVVASGVLQCPGRAAPVRSPGTVRETPEQIREPRLDRGAVVRRVGDFVGRRREQRLALRALRDRDGAGVLIHGMGGVGKSTLAAQLMHRLAADFEIALDAHQIDNDELSTCHPHR